MTVPFSGRLSFLSLGSALQTASLMRNGECPDQLRKEINYEVMKFRGVYGKALGADLFRALNDSV